MGRSLGYHDSDELDRSDLNKCPDCGCFFATDECPLCGKICPEEFRAGNRAKVKPPKKGRNSSGRVQFVPWYHTWWFILIMMYLFPIVGIILFFTSPYSKKTKIIVGSVVVGIYVLFFAVRVGSTWLQAYLEMPRVNDDISRTEYVERCENMNVEAFYRDPYDEGRYIVMELTVVERLPDQGADVYGVFDATRTYYLCRDPQGGEATVYIVDCNLETESNYLPGDRIRVYGESAGMESAFDAVGNYAELPCLYVAYCERIG